MPTLETRTMQRSLQIVFTLMPIIALAFLLNPQTQYVQTALAAAPVAAQEAEKKVTIEGVDSTRIKYEQDDNSTAPGIFRSHASVDDRDVATGSKIKSIVVTRPSASPVTHNCDTRRCTVVIETNHNDITVRELASDTIELDYQRAKFRYSEAQKANYSKKVHVKKIRVNGDAGLDNCNKCSVEITYRIAIQTR